MASCKCCGCKKKTPYPTTKPSLTTAALQNMLVLPELSHETYHCHEYLHGNPQFLTVASYFKIGEILGKGETSVVFDGVFLPSNEPVAIKFFENYRPVRRAIMRELEILNMSHECRHLIKYHSHFRVGVKCYIVTERCSGVNFDDFLSPKLNLPYSLIRIFMKQLSLAIMFLHKCHVVHRDITLKNLLLDKSGNLRLGDYGMCRTVSSPMGMRFTDWGTLHFAAPEVYQDELCSYPVDWWSAGVVLYRFVTGGLPFATNRRRSVSFHVVKHHSVIYPPEFFTDDNLVLLTSQLLKKSKEQRLGTKDDTEIMRHPFFQSEDWDKIENVEKAVLDSPEEELLWFKDTYKNIMSVIEDVFNTGRTSTHVSRWAKIEGLLHKTQGYGPRVTHKMSTLM